MTGRPIALKGISFLPDNLERVKLLPMNEEIQQEWFEKWSKIVIPNDPMAGRQEAENFKAFLAADNCPDDIKNELAKEPLLLYLLGRLHREEAIKQEDFDRAENSTQPKIIIYEKSLELVLKEQREEPLQYQITGLTTENLKRILMEAGLCVIQSGGEYARVEMIETRLDKDDSDAAQAIRDLRENSGEQALSTALGAFYIRPAAGKKGGGVEFYHKSFSEFLCAKRLSVSLEEWTETGGKRNKLIVDEVELARQIYDLLGYGSLTTEIVEYLWGLLSKSDEFQPVKLFDRLLDFYERWCDGEFIDAEGTTFPQTTMRELQKQCPDREIHLGQRQVDVYAGLNAMILLLELHRYGQSQSDENIRQQLIFHPCGKSNQEGQLEDSTKLLRIIGCSKCVGASGFRDIVGNFLEGANLLGANLLGANLSRANLSRANLSGANLSRANLSRANLSRANLSRANLSSANLDGANLEGANLEGANLEGANLEGANLVRANLEGANLEGANLEGAYLEGAYLEGAYLEGAYLSSAYLEGANLKNISWNESTNWNGVLELDQAINVPEDLKQYLAG